MVQAQLDEQGVAELPGGVDVELVPHGVVDLLLHLAELGLQRLPERPDALHVHREADGLHMGEHARERNLDFTEQLRLAVLGDFPLQRVRQGGHHRGGCGRAVGQLFRHRDAVFPREAQRLVPRGGGVQQVARQHRVERAAAGLLAARIQRGKQRLYVPGVFADFRVGEDGAHGFGVPHNPDAPVPVYEQRADFSVFRLRGEVGAPGLAQGLQQRVAAGALLGGGDGGRGGRLPALRLRGGIEAELFYQREELQLRHQPRGGRVVAPLRHVLGKVGVDRHVGADGAEPAGEERAVFPRGQPAAQGVADIQLPEVGVDIVDGVVRLNQLPCALRADARNARDAVGGVALERLDFDHFLRGDAVVGFDFRLVVQRDLRLPQLGGGEAHRHVRADELQAVAVARRQNAVAAAVGAGLRERAEDVVRLEALALHQAVPEQREQLFEGGHLLRELRRHPLAVRLVARVFPVAERRRAHVERHGHGVRRGLFQQAVENRQEAVNPVGVQAVFRRQQADSVERAVQNAVAVQYQ